ncbi:Staphylococcal virulence regulator protein A [uncultured Clostridium sp.]|uniref:MATE family efflux transporter n=1 Tax=uncultured Clostridium sp. TaxID=59620 RepID=UPI0008226B66|nr:MATE family efflux transporter [uncultured Clostridium sp.]SCJ93624.1 Staphylococcal virulence regulator protein A [uncultured Clostridium sp.]
MSNILSQKITTSSLIKFSIPTVIMMTFMSLYTMVDGIFISNFVGTDALSAVNLVSPFIMIISTIGIMLATGGSAIVARKMGERKIKESKENFSLLVVMGIIVGVAVLILGNIFINPLIKVLGANEVVSKYCYDYIKIMLAFMPALMLQVIFQSFFVTAGKSALGLGFVVVGGITNIILDYIFIAVLKMGLMGAGLATGIGYSIPGVLGFIYFLINRKGSLYLIKPKMDFKVLKESLINGSSEMVSNLASGITIYLFNIAMMKMIGSDGVASISVILYTDSLLVAIYMGYAMGVAPLISYNYGEENRRNLRKILKISVRTLLIGSVIVSAACVVFSKNLVSIFAPAGSNVFHIAAAGLPIFSIAFLFKGLNIFASSMFTALSNGKVSAVLSFLRTFVFLIVGIAVFPRLFNVTGLWISVPFAEILAIIVSIIYFRKLKAVYFDDYKGDIYEKLKA